MACRRLIGAFVGVFIGAGTASAVTYPTFVIDRTASSVSITGQSCIVSDPCSISAALSPGLGATTFTPTSVGDIFNLSNFIDWSVTGSGFSLGTFGVAATLAFSGPSAVSGSNLGVGMFATLSGIVSGGMLSWNSDQVLVDFGQGSILGLSFQGGETVVLGGSLTTGVNIEALRVTPVPLPAALPLFGFALGGFYVLGRRRKKAA